MPVTPETRALGLAKRLQNADNNPNNLAAVQEIRRYLAAGKKNTLQAIADDLNKKGIRTRRGKKFNAKSVSRILERYKVERSRKRVNETKEN